MALRLRSTQRLASPDFGDVQGLGMLVGSSQAVRQAEQQKMNRLDALMDASTKGVAAAQMGDASALSAQMNAIKEQIKSATTSEERLALLPELRALQALMPGTRQTATGNTARAIIQTRAALEDPTLPENIKKVLEQRLKVMSDNTDALAAADRFRFDQARMGSEMQRIEGENWLNANTSKMLEFIQNDDADGLEEFVAGAGQFSGAARRFAQSALAGQETMDRFKANSIAMKIAPDFKTGEGGAIISAERTDIESLPESIRDIFAPGLRKYENLIKEGWDDKNKTWREGYRTLASNAQREVQGLLNNVRNQIATSEYFAELNRTRDTEEQIRNLEVLKESDVSTREAISLADSFIPRKRSGKKKESLTPEKIEDAKALIRQSRNAAIDNQIRLLKGPQTEEEELEMAVLTVNGTDLVAADNKGRKLEIDGRGFFESNGSIWIPIPDPSAPTKDESAKTSPAGPASRQGAYRDY